MNNPNCMTLGVLEMQGFPAPFYCYLREPLADPSKEDQPITPMMDRKLLFEFMAQVNVQRFEIHGHTVEIDFAPPSRGEGPQPFALEGSEDDTVDGTLLLWDVSCFGGKAKRMGYEDVKALTPDDAIMFATTVKVMDDPKDPEFKTFNVECVRTKFDETKDVAATAALRVGKKFFRRFGSILKSFGGDLHSGMYDAKPAGSPQP